MTKIEQPSHSDDLEKACADCDFTSITEVTKVFTWWLMSYFKVWNPMDGVWLDADNIAYNIDQLWEEFVYTYAPYESEIDLIRYKLFPE